MIQPSVFKVKVSAAAVMLLFGAQAHSATNQATDPGGGSVSLTGSGNVTVSTTALQLVKQVWVGGTCYASQPADAACNSSATTVTVPVNTTVKFMIYVKNDADVALTDVRFQDVLDDSATGFTYQTGTIKSDASQNAAATAANIYTAVIAGGAESDAVDTGGTDYVSITDTNVEGGGKLEKLTVGAVATQINDTLSIATNTTFAIVFDAIKASD